MDDYVDVTMCFFGGKPLPRYPGWFSANFLATTFFLVGPPPARSSNLVGFWPILGLWHLDKFQAGAENTKTQFPGARGTFMGNRFYHAFRDGFPQRSRESLFFARTPTGRNYRFSGGFGPFWPISKCPRLKAAQNPTGLLFPAGGGPTEKKVVTEKVAETHPG